MKKMLYIDQSDGTQYEARFTDNSMGLHRAEQDTHWAADERGEEIASLSDQGNGVKIMLEGHPAMDLDYDEVFTLQMLIRGYVLDLPCSNLGGSIARYELKGEDK